MVIGPFDDRTYCVRSAFTHLGDLVKAVRVFKAKTIQSHKVCCEACCINIFVDLQPFGFNLKDILLDLIQMNDMPNPQQLGAHSGTTSCRYGQRINLQTRTRTVPLREAFHVCSGIGVLLLCCNLESKVLFFWQRDGKKRRCASKVCICDISNGNRSTEKAIILPVHGGRSKDSRLICQ